MALGAKRSDKSAASTATLYQRMRPRSDQRRRTDSSTCSATQLTRGNIAPNVTHCTAARRVMSKNVVSVAKFALTLALGALGGWVMWHFDLPLAWLAGAIIATGVGALSGCRSRCLPLLDRR
ncbi:protein of unknown function (plasmid) [Agrobacterium pusense]|uniref:Uncharacterized protein n=1 Tax=Agrobacterium pusense TaxID=648995 RepID=U4QI47_9HYPH|nr:protein of unknown function [Agrobacterium pusense]